MTDVSRIDDLIALIYAAAVDPQRWGEFLDRFADVLNSAILLLLVRLPRPGDQGAAVATGIDPQCVRSYQQHYYAVDPWLARAAECPAGTVEMGDLLVPQSTVVCGEFYNDWMLPQRLLPTLPAAGVIRQEAPAAVIGSFARRGGRVAEPRVLRMFKRLLPHWRHALDIHHTVGSWMVQRAAGAAVYDQLPFGTFFVDLQGRVLASNIAARAIIDEQDGLEVVDERLRAAFPVESARLFQLIAQAARAPQPDGVPPGALGVRRPSGRADLVVQVSPIRFDTESWWQRSEIAVVYVDVPDVAVETDTEVLRRLYHLTSKEAALAVRLLDGQSVKLAAGELAITFNTARSHLRRIFEKTATNRQAALVRLLLTGPARLSGCASGSEPK